LTGQRAFDRSFTCADCDLKVGFCLAVARQVKKELRISGVKSKTEEAGVTKGCFLLACFFGPVYPWLMEILTPHFT
jgi:hypothetical protein